MDTDTLLAVLIEARGRVPDGSEDAAVRARFALEPWEGIYGGDNTSYAKIELESQRSASRWLYRI